MAPAKIYDPLGLISPEALRGKLVYCAVCDSKRAWDAEPSRDMAKAWVKWESSLAQGFDVPRSLAVHRKEIEGIELHSFGDASASGVAACVNAVVRQAAGTNQGVIAARSRLSKPDHPAARARCLSYGCEPGNQRKTGSGRITLDEDALLAGQLGCLILNKGARRARAVCVESCVEGKQSSWSYVALCPHRRKPSPSQKLWRPPRGSRSVVERSQVARKSRELAG